MIGKGPRLNVGVRPLINPLKMPGSRLLKKVQMREAKPDKGGSVHERT